MFSFKLICIACFLLHCNGAVVRDLKLLQSLTNPSAQASPYAQQGGSSNLKSVGTGGDCSASECYDVVIIGAGIAGLAAADQLRRTHDINNFTVLEARDRIGGRVHTVRSDSDGTFIEMGAEFIHGETRNSVFQFANQKGLLALFGGTPQDSWFNLNGQEVSVAEVKEIDRVYRQFRRELEYEHDLTTSVGTALKEKFEKWLRLNMNNAAVKRAIFYYFYLDECLAVSDDLSKLSTDQDYDYVDASGKQEYSVENGVLSVLEHLIGELIPLNKPGVQLNSLVKKINYDVNCQGGTRVSFQLQSGKKILAKYAIVTLPLGTLKANCVHFTPPLPQSKLKAIQRVGFGCINKVFLHFQRKWWRENTHVNVLYQQTIPDGVSVTSKYYTAANSSWYRNLVSFSIVPGNPLALEAWLTGAPAETVEKLPIEEVQHVVEQILHRAFSKQFDIENPLRVERSQWCNDQNSLGGFSYISMDSRASDFEALASPLPESGDSRVYFAGEHTSSTQWSSLQGAYDTGRAAADKVAAALQNKHTY